MADEMVRKTQEWLNATYGNDSRFKKVPTNGQTGWATIYGLRRALQIELGIQATSDNFGPTTTALFNSTYPTGVHQQSADDETESNVYGIIQGGLWCKGYSTGASEITKHFYSGTGNGVKSLKSDAGCSDSSSTVTINVMKALLSMDQFKLVSGGTTKIRTIQQTLNKDYEAYIGLGPCDGLYGREMNLALIKVLQAIEGYSVSEATGNFGSGTKEKLPIVPSTGQISSETEAKAILLVRYALCCNGYDVPINSSQWDSNLSDKIEEFQGEMCIEQVRICDTNTWMALLVSTGNPDRSFTACDTAYGIRGKRIEDLKNKGITTIGRYIVGGSSKELDFEEEKTIIDNGFKLFPIFQNNGTPSVKYFTATQGLLDASSAYRGAKLHCIPKNAIIYFAVDVDVLGEEIATNILPYFKAVKENLQDYRIGVYGTRNVCTKVIEAKYAITCFVSDMSTGYSGNMGFRMPKNWNFDQFGTMSFTNSQGTWYIDKVASSGRFEAVDKLSQRYLYEDTITITGENSGRGIFYGGDKLRMYITATGTNSSIDYKDVRLEAIIKALSPIPDPLYEQQKFISAPIDGSVHSFQDTVNAGLDPYNRDYMRIYPNTEYQIIYKVLKNGELLNNVPVEVHVTVETED